jgi:hypothetical protein
MLERLFGFVHVDNCCKYDCNKLDYNLIFINILITLLTTISIVYLIYNRSIQFELQIKNWPIPMRLNKNTNIKRWLENYRLYFKLHRIKDDSSKRSILIHQLDSKSYDLVNSLIDDIKSYQELEDLIVKLFDKDYLNDQKYINPFFKCKQENNETIQCFYARLFKNAQLAFPFVSKMCKDKLIRERFFQGLKSHELSFNLRSKFMHDDKLVKIVNFAIKMEKNQKNLNRTTKSYNFVTDKFGFDQYGSFNDDNLKLKQDY